MPFDLDQHLSQEHNLNPFSTYLKEIVYGGNDGIVTTFAVVAGFTGAQAQPGVTLPVLTVLLFGFANLAADGVSMALGNLLSSQSEKDVYANFKARELHEIKYNPETEKAESIEILKRKGFNSHQSEQLVSIYSTNEAYWLEFMMEKELELPNPEGEQPLYMALATFVSFVGFGLIPLVPYLFFQESGNVFVFSIFATAAALLLLGLLRFKVTRHSLSRSMSETLLLGGIAASVAYGVGTLFRI